MWRGQSFCFLFEECPMCVFGLDETSSWPGQRLSQCRVTEGWRGQPTRPRQELVRQERRLCGTKRFFLVPLSPSRISLATTPTRPSSGCLFFWPKRPELTSTRWRSAREGTEEAILVLSQCYFFALMPVCKAKKSQICPNVEVYNT